MARIRRGAKQNPWLVLFGLVALGAILERPIESVALVVLTGVVLFSPMGAPFLTKLKEWWAVQNPAPVPEEPVFEPSDASSVAFEKVDEPESVKAGV